VIVRSRGKQHRFEMRREVRQIANMVGPGNRPVIAERDPAVKPSVLERTPQRRRPQRQFTIGDLRSGHSATASQDASSPSRARVRQGRDGARRARLSP